MPVPGAATWTDPGWRSAHLAWVTAALETGGLAVVGPVEQVHVRPWSTLFAIPTDAGRLWSKAAGPGTRHEAAVLERFAAWGVAHVLRPIAVDVDRGWLLLPDGGTRLRDTAPDLTGDHDLAAWERLLPVYAGLQRGVAARVGELLAAGVPDERPARYPAILAGLLEDEAIWARVEPADRAAVLAARGDLAARLQQVAELAAALGDTGIEASIDHGDLHGGNILVDASGESRFFDWGDSAVAHPFETLTWTLASIGRRLDLAPDDPVLRRLTAAYTEAWTDRASRPDLAAAARLAVRLGPIGKAAAWERALAGLAPDAMGGHHGETAATLVDLRGRLAAA